MRVKLLVAISLTLLLGAALLGTMLLGAGLLGVLLLHGCASQTPIPAAVTQDSPEEKDPTYGLPLEITIENVPEVPKEIRGPLPPLEDQGQQHRAKPGLSRVAKLGTSWVPKAQEPLGSL